MHLDCPHFLQGCSGCALQQEIDPPPLLGEVRQFFKATFECEVAYSSGAIKQWRSRAKLAVRGEKEAPFIGLYRQNTHIAVNIPLCQVQHDKLNQAADLVREWIAQEGILPYHEESQTGCLRYLQMSLQTVENKVQLTLVLQSTLNLKIIENLWKQGQDLLHSIWINYNQSKGNTILGSKWELCFGQEWLLIKLRNKIYSYHPSSFVQANLEQFEVLLQDVHDHILTHKKVVEYYAGSGIIGLSLLDKSAQLMLIESNPQSLLCFEESTKNFSDQDKQKIKYISTKADSAANLIQESQAEVIIIDPPRKGLDPFLMEQICSSTSLEQVIWISCGWSSFKKGATLLKEHGFAISFAKSYLFFPGTNQLEILAIFNPPPKTLA